jgi:acetyl esterase/lipase
MLYAGVAPVWAGEAGKLLPAETELVATLNLRQFLDDHRDTGLVQRYLEPFRLALRGDEKPLREFYRGQEWLKGEGINEQDFLKRAKLFKSVADALGVDVLQDIDRISWGLKRGTAGSWALVVEGRFQEGKFRTAVEELAKQHLGPCKVSDVGGIQVCQIPDGDNGVQLALLNGRTLAIVGSKPWLDNLLAQFAGKKEAGLSAGMRTLLDSAAKEHVGLALSQAAVLLNETAKFLENAGLDPQDAVGKLLVNQLTAWIDKNGNDVSEASIGLSVGVDELRLQFGVETKKQALAEELRTAIDRGTLVGGLALKFADDDCLQQLGRMLLKVRVTLGDSTVIVRGPVTYQFLKQLTLGPGHRYLEGLSRRLSNITLWGPVKPQPDGAFAVETVRDISYRDDGKADPYRHRLDLFVPKGKKDCPVVVLVHGGAWILGDNRCCGLYTSVGHFLASQGIVAVLPNYRLSPHVKHPAHVQDLASAVRWTRSNIAKHGGNPERLFLAGHSAGAHLAALLATDESHLRAEGLKTSDIQGVVAVSGVYHIPAQDEPFTLGGSGPRSCRLDQLWPPRGYSGPLLHLPLGIPFMPDPYGPAFGDDPKIRAAASPLSHVRRGLPPFLILIAEHDLPTVPDMADEFQKTLQREGCAARLIKVTERNHSSVMFSAISREDPAARAILEFIRQPDKKP